MRDGVINTMPSKINCPGSQSNAEIGLGLLAPDGDVGAGGWSHLRPATASRCSAQVCHPPPVFLSPNKKSLHREIDVSRVWEHREPVFLLMAPQNTVQWRYCHAVLGLSINKLWLCLSVKHDQQLLCKKKKKMFYILKHFFFNLQNSSILVRMCRYTRWGRKSTSRTKVRMNKTFHCGEQEHVHLHLVLDPFPCCCVKYVFMLSALNYIVNVKNVKFSFF